MILAVEPEKILTREALAEPHRTYITSDERENDEIRILSLALKNSLKDELANSRTSKSKHESGGPGRIRTGDPTISAKTVSVVCSSYTTACCFHAELQALTFRWLACSFL